MSATLVWLVLVGAIAPLAAVWWWRAPWASNLFRFWFFKPGLGPRAGLGAACRWRRWRSAWEIARLLRDAQQKRLHGWWAWARPRFVEGFDAIRNSPVFVGLAAGLAGAFREVRVVFASALTSVVSLGVFAALTWQRLQR